MTATLPVHLQHHPSPHGTLGRPGIAAACPARCARCAVLAPRPGGVHALMHAAHACALTVLISSPLELAMARAVGAHWRPRLSGAAESAAQSRRCGCREALVLVAVPMVASAVSTVITTTPLFAATTLILKRFAAVIFVTMLVGLAYVVLFLTPVLAMFGPGRARQRDKTMVPSYWKVFVEHLLNSKAVRLFAVIIFMLIAMVRHPHCVYSPDA